MIAVDTSALICIYAEEAGFEACRRKLAHVREAFLPVPCYVEFLMISKLKESRKHWLDALLETGPLALAPLETVHASVAYDAVARFGKGSGHRARLNFGDCLTYAVAKHRDLPLLFVGDDFRHTDIVPALALE